MSSVPDYHKGIVGTKSGVCDREWGKQAWVCPNGEDSRQIEPLEALDKHGHFLDVIEEKCQSAVDVVAGRTVVRITEKALESAVSGRVVKLD